MDVIDLITSTAVFNLYLCYRPQNEIKQRRSQHNSNSNTIDRRNNNKHFDCLGNDFSGSLHSVG